MVWDSIQNGNSYPQYRLTSSPEDSSSKQPVTLITSAGSQPRGKTFVTWSPTGGANGTIVVSDSTSSSLFINQALGQGNWKEVKTSTGRAYAREVRAGMFSSRLTLQEWGIDNCSAER